MPIVIGCEQMVRYDLQPKRSGYYNGYDITCDAGINQELATAAFRFGHSLIRANFPRMNGNFNANAHKPIDLLINFNNATTLYDETNGHMESILMGLLGAPGYTLFLIQTL